MTIGKITSSQQDIVFVKVRPEDDTFLETHNGAVKANYYVASSVGERFTAARWFGRIKIKIGNVNEAGKVRIPCTIHPQRQRHIMKTNSSCLYLASSYCTWLLTH